MEKLRSCPTRDKKVLSPPQNTLVRNQKVQRESLLLLLHLTAHSYGVLYPVLAGWGFHNKNATDQGSQKNLFPYSFRGCNPPIWPSPWLEDACLPRPLTQPLFLLSGPMYLILCGCICSIWTFVLSMMVSMDVLRFSTCRHSI